MEEREEIDQWKMKGRIITEYKSRVRKILKTKLSSKNKLTAKAMYTVQVIQYSFRILEWSSTEIQNLDRKTRKLLTIHGLHQFEF